MTKASKRLVATARKVLSVGGRKPSEAEVMELANRVAASLAARKAG